MTSRDNVFPFHPFENKGISQVCASLIRECDDDDETAKFEEDDDDAGEDDRDRDDETATFGSEDDESGEEEDQVKGQETITVRRYHRQITREIVAGSRANIFDPDAELSTEEEDGVSTISKKHRPVYPNLPDRRRHNQHYVNEDDDKENSDPSAGSPIQILLRLFYSAKSSGCSLLAWNPHALPPCTPSRGAVSAPSTAARDDDIRRKNIELKRRLVESAKKKAATMSKNVHSPPTHRRPSQRKCKTAGVINRRHSITVTPKQPRPSRDPTKKMKGKKLIQNDMPLPYLDHNEECVRAHKKKSSHVPVYMRKGNDACHCSKCRFVRLI